MPEGTKVLICFPYTFNKKQKKGEQLLLISKQGYVRFVDDGKLLRTDEVSDVNSLGDGQT